MRNFLAFVFILVGLALVGFLFGVAMPAHAQVTNNYWLLSSGTLKPNLSTWSLTIPQLGGTGVRCVQVDNGGLFSVAAAGCSSGGGTFPFTPTTFGSSAANSTSTLIGFLQGLYALASSTIGDGTPTGGLTINGGATTTGNGYFATNLFVGTTTLYQNSSVNRFAVTGDTTNTSGAVVLAPGLSGNNRTLTLTGNTINAAATSNASAQFLLLQNNGAIVGVGTTTPYALLSVATKGDATGAVNTLFAIGSSTNYASGAATTTLLAVTNTGLMVFASTTNTSALTNPYGFTQGLLIPNKPDTVTNFENASIGWQGNVFYVQTQPGGTGTNRALTVQALNSTGGSPSLITFNAAGTAPGVLVKASIGTSVTGNQITTTGPSAASGMQVLTFINTSATAQSGTAGYSLLDLTANETTVGTGNKYLQRWIASTTAVNGLQGTVTEGVVTDAGLFGIGTTSPYARLSIHTNNNDTNSITLFAIGSSTSNATTTLFSVSNIGTTTLGRFGSCSGTNALTTDSSGNIVCGVITGTGDGVGNWFTPTTFGSTAANSTSTLIGFTQGIYALASSTIGDSTQAGGLTINGGATTTGNAYFVGNLGVGTSTLATNSLITLGAQAGELTTASDLLTINSMGLAGISLQGDNGNSSGEPGGAYIKFGVDGALTQGLLGVTQGNGIDPTRTALVGALNNATVLAANSVSALLQLAVSGVVDATINSSGSFGLGTTSPLGLLTVSDNTANANVNAFLISSSTANATTTLLSLSNTGLLTFASSTNTSASTNPYGFTQGIVIPNKPDLSVNFENASLGWQGNVFYVQTQNGGTAVTRSLALQSSNNTGGSPSVLTLTSGAVVGVVPFAYNTSSNSNGTQIAFTSSGTGSTQAGLSASSGTQNFFTINPAYNQTGTAGFKTLRLVSNEWQTGTGVHYLQTWEASTTAVNGQQGVVTEAVFTNAGLFGLGTTSPYARLSIHANNGDTNGTVLFAIGSSTALATTTLFSVDNTGLTTIVNASTTNITASNELVAPSGSSKGSTVAGQIELDTTDDQLKVGDGSATVVFDQYKYPSWGYATSTWSATTTLLQLVAPFGGTMKDIQCKSAVGTLNVQLLVNSTKALPMFNASSTEGTVTFASSNTFVKGDILELDAGTPATSPQSIYCTGRATVTGT